MISFNYREIVGETIRADQKEVYYFGPNLTLRDCTLTLSVPRSDLILAAARFEGCTIIGKKKGSNLRWHNVFLSGCRFSGTLSAWEFGRTADGDPDAGLTDCDFSEARLDACGFHNVDVSTVTFPGWPCFALIDPGAHAEALLAAPWPGKSRILGELMAECEPEYTAAVYDATAIAKRYEVDEEALRGAIASIPDARL